MYVYIYIYVYVHIYIYIYTHYISTNQYLQYLIHQSNLQLDSLGGMSNYPIRRRLFILAWPIHKLRVCVIQKKGKGSDMQGGSQNPLLRRAVGIPTAGRALMSSHINIDIYIYIYTHVHQSILTVSNSKREYCILSNWCISIMHNTLTHLYNYTGCIHAVALYMYLQVYV